MSVLVSQFRPRIAMRVQSCPDPLIDMSVVDTCIDFCERSTVMRRTLDPITTRAGVNEYDIDLPDCNKLVRIIKSWVDGYELTPSNEEDVVSPFGFVRSVTGLTNGSSRPTTFVFTEPNIIGVYPSPDKAYTITMRVAMKPCRDEDCVEDELYEDWLEVITHGALARIYTMPEFANPSFAVAHLGQYEVGINYALIQANRARTVAESRINPVHV